MPERDDRLEPYRSMRDFEASPEPEGAVRHPEPDAPRFVVQEHHATRLHWDLRLERDGVLASWAIPKGLPWSPDQDNLAVHTEDHPLEYLEFSGEIPEGSYGAGTMTMWDGGTYEPLKFEDGKVVVDLHGERVQGRYALFSIDGDDWMIHRMDPPADPDRRPLPRQWRPMQATALDHLGDLPGSAGDYAFELWWAGRRCLIRSSGGRIEVVDGQGDDFTAVLPEIRRMGPTLGSTEAVLDAVLVGLGPEGVPLHDPAPVDHRLAAPAGRARRLERRQPLAAMLVDLVWLEGHALTDQPYVERRRMLTELDLSSDAWQTPRHHRGDPAPFLDAVGAQGGQGILAKRLDSGYEPGGVSSNWCALPARDSPTRA